MLCLHRIIRTRIFDLLKEIPVIKSFSGIKNGALKAKRLGEGGTQAFGIYFIPYLRKSCQGCCDKSL